MQRFFIGTRFADPLLCTPNRFVEEWLLSSQFLSNVQNSVSTSAQTTSKLSFFSEELCIIKLYAFINMSDCMGFMRFS